MKPSSFVKVAFAASWFLLFIAFTPVNKAASPAAAVHQNAHYYYYWADDDSFDAYNTVSDEIVHLQGIVGATVNTNPLGGTLLARGYINNWYPHGVWPSSYLYVHY